LRRPLRKVLRRGLAGARLRLLDRHGGPILTEESMEEVRIDVRDVDYEWFRDVKAFLDRDLDRYLFPQESADRLGEFDEDAGCYYLIDGQVEAKADEIESDGQHTACWSVSCAQLIVRPASDLVRRDGTGI